MAKRYLTEKQEEFIKECYVRGVATKSQLADMFHCSATTIDYTIHPEHRERAYAARKARSAAKKRKVEMVDSEQIDNNIRSLTLAEVAKKVETGTKRIDGEIRNATIEDLATLSDMFNVKFTVYFD